MTPRYHEHFLTRILRLGDEAVEGVMLLWYEPDTVRDMIARAKSDAGRPISRQVALQVDDGGRTAHVVVALDGSPVTVLAPEMGIADVDVVLPWSAFEEARARSVVRREADAKLDALRAHYPWRVVWRSLQDGEHLAREVVEWALADSDFLRMALPGALRDLRERHDAITARYYADRFTDGEREKRRLGAVWAVVHAARLAGAAHAADCGRTLAELSLDPIPAIAAASAGALSRLDDQHFLDFKRISKSPDVDEWSRALALLIVGLTASVRSKRESEVMKALASVEASDSPDSLVGSMARWLRARPDAANTDELPELRGGTPAWTTTVFLAFNEVLVPIEERYQPEEEAATARAEADENFARMPRTRVEKRSTRRRDGPAVGRNDPCPCGSGRKFKRCCGAVSAA